MDAFTAFMSSTVSSELSGCPFAPARTSSAQTRLEPVASIWPSTNFRLVSATVTTNTIDALPIITPSEVRIARSLFPRSASIATDNVSRKSIMARPSAVRSFALPQPLQRFPRALAFRLQLQRRLVFPDGRLRLVLVLVQPPQPLMRAATARIVASRRSLLEVLPQ